MFLLHKIGGFPHTDYLAAQSRWFSSHRLPCGFLLHKICVFFFYTKYLATFCCTKYVVFFTQNILRLFAAQNRWFSSHRLSCDFLLHKICGFLHTEYLVTFWPHTREDLLFCIKLGMTFYGLTRGRTFSLHPTGDEFPHFIEDYFNKASVSYRLRHV